jgi:hypothetical protein
MALRSFWALHGGEFNLVMDALASEGDRLLSLTTVEIVNQANADFLH